MLPKDPLTFGKFPECQLRCGFEQPEVQRFQSLKLLFSLPTQVVLLPSSSQLGFLLANSHLPRAILIHRILYMGVMQLQYNGCVHIVRHCFPVSPPTLYLFIQQVTLSIYHKPLTGTGYWKITTALCKLVTANPLVSPLLRVQAQAVSGVPASTICSRLRPRGSGIRKTNSCAASSLTVSRNPAYPS